MKPVITGITVSFDFADKNYGNGSACFSNAQARYPDPGLPLEQVNQVVGDGLDLYFTCWQTLMLGRYTAGIISGAEHKKALESAVRRLGKVREYLKTI